MRSLRLLANPLLLQRGTVYGLSFLILASAGWLSGDDGFFWAATASIWTCLVDRAGPLRERTLALASVGVGGAVACAVGAGVASTPVLALLVVLAGGLCAGLAEIRGAAYALSAKLLYVVLIASCLLPLDEPALGARMLAFSVDYLQGGIFAMLFCLVLIRSVRDARPRAEVVAVFGALHRFARTLAGAGANGTEGTAGTTAVDFSADKREIRSRIEAARQGIHAVRGIREPLSLVYYSYMVTLADTIFALLIVALELRTREGTNDATGILSAGGSAGLPLRHVLRSLSDAHEQVQQELNTGTPDLRALATALHLELKRLQAPVINAGAPPVYQAALTALARFPAFDAWRSNFRWPRRGLRHGWQRTLAAMAEHTARDARVARHAVRLAFVGCLSLLPSQIFEVDHGYWVAVTVIMVLSPQLATTRQISGKRFAGSLVGALFACAVGLIHPSVPVALAISAICLALAYTFRLAGDPGRFAFFLTPAVILFSWIGHPAADSSHFAALRGIDTALGCLMALASYYILAPRAEMSRVYRHSLDALAANAVYLRAAFTAAATGGAPGASPGDRLARLEALRVSAGRASTRAEDTMLQAGADIAPALIAEYTRLHAITRQMAALAGLVRAGMDAGSIPDQPGEQTHAVLDWLEAKLAELAIRPGGTADMPGGAPAAVSAMATVPANAGDAFLQEQARYAADYMRNAHATVIAVRALAGAKPGRRLPAPA